MFEDATFHSNSIQSSQTPKWMLLAFAVNLSLLSALIVLPLIYPEGLPSRLLQRVLYVPTPKLVTQPQSRSVQPASAQASDFRNPLAAPPVIPSRISKDPDAPPPSTIMDMSSTPGTVPGGAGDADTIFKSAPRPEVHQAPTKVTISQGVIDGLLIFKTTPAYPIIAKTAGISGTIVLAAVISKSGAIENLRVLSGPPMLRLAAIDAVQNWRYRPYLLNNQPVEVETTIHVVFSLGGR